MPEQPSLTTAAATDDLAGLPALSIMQPWAALIAFGLKDIENRDWPTKFRGPFLIHAGRTLDTEAYEDVGAGIHPVSWDALGEIPPRFDQGGIVGMAEVVDCVSASDSEWFVGPYGFVIARARPLDLIPCVGALGFFHPDFSKTYKPKGRARPKSGKVASPTEPDLFGGSDHE